MPSTRRLKTAIILAVFATLTILYVTQAPSNTHNSPFYTRTVAAIQARRDNEARESLMAEEKTRADRVARIQEEHDQAMVANKQKPIVEDAPTTSRSQEAAPAESKPAAGRKMSPPADGTTGNKGGKVVVNPNSDDHEGVARVGNTGSSKSHESSAAKKKESQSEEESASDHEIEVEMNSILKKGPIIIFSKSYCPFSMKAKVCSNALPIMSPLAYLHPHILTIPLLLPNSTSSSPPTQ
jgi:FtsZ-interacting cell division protein ZipA